MSFLSHFHGSHPTSEVLALYSRLDLPLLSRLRVKTHLMHCASCEHHVESFAEAVRVLKDEAAAETLTAFEAIADWKQLESEMLGNIVVGVAAARCIENVGRKRVWLSRFAVAAGVVLLFVIGWITHIPGEETGHLFASVSRVIGIHHKSSPPNFLQATPSGIEVQSQGVTLRMLHPASAYVSLSGNSSVEARYVDEQSGQLTIAKVYGQ